MLYKSPPTGVKIIQRLRHMEDKVKKAKEIQEEFGAEKKAKGARKRDAEFDNDDESETKKIKKETEIAQVISLLDEAIEECCAQPQTGQGQLAVEFQTEALPFVRGLRASAPKVIKRTFG
ncbi:uncharacterized protein GLRG_04542 [Colletotrichum graminicola M1.001]|uniref:Uncharacterized protein n=1 Tax=Colletotrichum graminicola (strain M1.001 / M2 / FGSC 10212) TaxID=645133 RepID=E3QEU2_COLGM|nr:uncharacterized protein GLRG_04542 [Colletotrichum graminicola M1.001]EFQ29398.1 hypothetical protein GLRG_04542 [Colletotrichum graminicola M1.001]